MKKVVCLFVVAIFGFLPQLALADFGGQVIEARVTNVTPTIYTSVDLYCKFQNRSSADSGYGGYATFDLVWKISEPNSLPRILVTRQNEEFSPSGIETYFANYLIAVAGSYLHTCEMRSADGAQLYGSKSALFIASCANECSAGTSGCKDSSTFWTCQYHNTSGCYYKVYSSCNCRNSACVTCTDECNSGSSGCENSTTFYECRYSNSTGCYYKQRTSCNCRNDACQTCTNECSSGDTGCASGTESWDCHYNSSTNCYYKHTTSCGATTCGDWTKYCATDSTAVVERQVCYDQVCSNRACQAVYRQNERTAELCASGYFCASAVCCKKHESAVCDGSKIRWADCNGVLNDDIRDCGTGSCSNWVRGCNASGTKVVEEKTCTEYWCENLACKYRTTTETRDLSTCGSNQTCSGGNCVTNCRHHDHFVCHNGDIYHADCNGDWNDFEYDCGENLYGDWSAPKCNEDNTRVIKTRDCHRRGCVNNACVDNPYIDMEIVRTCESWQQCVNGACVNTCVNECSSASDKGCVDGDTRWECRYNSDRECFYRFNVACGDSQNCQDGRCVVQCSDICLEGKKECFGFGWRECLRQSDGCLGWSAVTLCPEDFTCFMGDCIQTSYHAYGLYADDQLIMSIEPHLVVEDDNTRSVNYFAVIPDAALSRYGLWDMVSSSFAHITDYGLRYIVRNIPYDIIPYDGTIVRVNIMWPESVLRNLSPTMRDALGKGLHFRIDLYHGISHAPYLHFHIDRWKSGVAQFIELFGREHVVSGKWMYWSKDLRKFIKLKPINSGNLLAGVASVGMWAYIIRDVWVNAYKYGEEAYTTCANAHYGISNDDMPICEAEQDATVGVIDTLLYQPSCRCDGLGFVTVELDLPDASASQLAPGYVEWTNINELDLYYTGERWPKKLLWSGKDQVVDGDQNSVVVPLGQQFKIVFPTLAGYITPSDQEMTVADDVTVRGIYQRAAGQNQPPVARANYNLTYDSDAGTAQLQLSAGGSVDPDGDPLIFRWSQSPNNPQQLSLVGNLYEQITTVPIPGSYLLQLTVVAAGQESAPYLLRIPVDLSYSVSGGQSDSSGQNVPTAPADSCSVVATNSIRGLPMFFIPAFYLFLRLRRRHRSP